VDVSEVARFSTLPEGELAVALLRNHGIDARLPDREVANSLPHLQIAIGAIRVIAPRAQVAHAREILVRAREGAFADDSDDGEWAEHAAPDGRVGELEPHEINGMIGASRKAGVAVVISLLVLSVVGSLVAFG
jgi:hypothetical protein